MKKDFADWFQLKAEIHDHHKAPTFREREIWWCSVGVNVGDEVDGKNEFCHRPVLIVRKFNDKIFLGLPLTTQIKPNRYYLGIRVRGKEQCVMLSQIRLWDAKRLTDPLGKLPHKQFKRVKQALRELFR